MANANFLQEDVENVESPPAQRFVATNCMSCHSVSDPEADFRIDRLLEQNAVEPNLFQWKEVLSRLESRDMPPKGHPRPEEDAYEEAAISIRSAVERAEEAILAKQPRAMRRLNRDEYVNTIRDLFGIRFRPGEDFPVDGMLHGFDTVAEGLVLSPSLVERYLRTANTVLERALRPIDSNLQPKTERYAFYEEHDSYPQGTPLSGLGVYNGNAHMTFPQDGKKRVVYIGGPAIFAYRHIDPIVNPVHAFHSEGVYRLKVTLTPQKFDPGDVASFIVLGTDKRRIADIDVTVPENGKPMTLEAECYYDRSESMAGFEIQWTNGNHLQWPSRGRLLSLPFDGSDQNKPWWHINYRMEGNQRVEWKPQTPEELPFSYFEKVELEITGPFL
ncbi:MAG: DUF1587 domain-containing protein, partial [Pirellula sp.]|nr:DUF1587 domain-containing protein [Pirellula sp.]